MIRPRAGISRAKLSEEECDLRRRMASGIHCYLFSVLKNPTTQAAPSKPNQQAIDEIFTLFTQYPDILDIFRLAKTISVMPKYSWPCLSLVNMFEVYNKKQKENTQKENTQIIFI